MGAGLGTLTKFLANKVKKVFAIESDPKLIEVLKAELKPYNNVEIINEDILKLEPKIFAHTKIVSNPPYKISSPLTFKIIKSKYRFSVMTYQKEFADRMIATPGSRNYSRISIGIKYYANVEYLKIVPKSYFHPVPKVDSALIRLNPCEPPFALANEEDFFDFVRYLFSFRNKSVRRALLLYLKNQNLIGLDTTNLLEGGLAKERIFRLSLQEFHELYRNLRDLQGDST